MDTNQHFNLDSSHAGINYSARDENELIELTLDLLSRNKVLLLIDNYEDIEDNTSDPHIEICMDNLLPFSAGFPDPIRIQKLSLQLEEMQIQQQVGFLLNSLI